MLTDPPGELTVTTVRKKPVPKPAGLAVKVRETPGPPATVAGAPLTVSQLSAAVTDVIALDPDPIFCNATDCESAAVFDAVALNSIRLELKTNCGDGAVTF